MSDTSASDDNPDRRLDPQQSPARIALYVSLPLLLLALAGAWLIGGDPLRLFDTGAPPVEKLTFERVYLDEDGIHLKVRAGGDEPLVIAQAQVDDAYWTFTQNPSGPLTRTTSAWLEIPYPWVAGDTHVIRLVTKTGVTFDHVIDVAVAVSTGQVGSLRNQAIIGGFVGILPVAIGLMFFPLMRNLQRRGMRFVLALTCGMLAFLLIDTLEAALEFGAQASAVFQGTAMVLLVAGTTCLSLIALGRRDGVPSGLGLATYVALGIGLHNFGEGLAIGAAMASGAAGLGAFLVIGFTVHNLTEGIAIAAPLVRDKPKLIVFAGLALLAGTPAIPGIWLGSYAISPQWAALALAIATGAILQVLFEVGSYSFRGEGEKRFTFDRYALGGLIFGIAFMYLTAMAIKV
ncbi:MAG: ZIP family metal transporter [Hyphomicrobiales bacterium]